MAIKANNASANIREVNAVVVGSTEGILQISDAAAELSQLAGRLAHLVSEFQLEKS
jgi:methyl-accepting chemotaxis protein